MAVAEYVTKEDLEECMETMLKRIRTDMADMEARIKDACALHSREQADRMIEAIQRRPSSNY